MKTVIFDTETTGFVRSKLVPLEKQPKIIEIFGLSLDDECNEVGFYHQLFNPGKPLDPKIIEITNITDEMLKDQPPFAEKADEVLNFFGEHGEAAAHNATFDRQMLDIEFRRIERTFSWPRLICTVEKTHHLKGMRLTLTALHEHLFGEKFEGAHRAETDVRALAKCFIKLRKEGKL